MSALIAQIHIFADRHLRDQCELLMDNDDTKLFRILDSGKLTDLSVVNDISLIGTVGIDAAQYVHQG